jgi:hypothetical protein
MSFFNILFQSIFFSFKSCEKKYVLADLNNIYLLAKLLKFNLI